jgi:hypothetical protein
MFGAQPLTQPFLGMLFYCPIGFANRTKTEVVRPTDHPLVELLYSYLGVQLGPVMSSILADCITDANHPRLGRDGTEVGSSRLRRVRNDQTVE